MRSNSFKLDPAIVADLDLPFAVGDFVKRDPNRGVHHTIGCTLEIERISLDHTCGAGHEDACYQPAYISYHVVYGAKPDGSAVYRGRMHAHEIVKVWSKS
jgi:hypothetical protein